MKINNIITENAGNIGRQIKAAYQKIYNAGDDAVEFAYYDSPIFAQYWDEYEGDLDSIIAEVDPQELQVILDELQSAAEDQGVAEAGEYTRTPSGDYINMHTGVRSSTAPTQKKVRGYKWEVHFDYGPHMSDSVVVTATSENEARAKAEKAAQKVGRSIMINWAKPKEQGVAESQRLNKLFRDYRDSPEADMTVGSPKIVYKNGRAVGEIGLDHDPSPGQGPFYMKHYETNTWYSGYDTKKEALDDLKHVVAQMNEGIGADTAKLGGIAALGIAGGLAGNYVDQQQPKVEIGGKIAFVEPAHSRVPDSAMTLTGKDGKTYRVWATKGTVQSPQRYHAVPVEGVKEGAEERKRNALWAQITSYEKRAKETQNDIKKQHLLKMADELRGKLPATNEEKLEEALAALESTIVVDEAKHDRRSDPEYQDPEVARKADKAQARYPYHDRTAALIKTAVRGLAHSEENDAQQQAELAALRDDVEQLKDVVVKLTQR